MSCQLLIASNPPEAWAVIEEGLGMLHLSHFLFHLKMSKNYNIPVFFLLLEADSSRRRRDVIFGNETYGQIETTETFYNLTSLKPETDYVIEIRGRTSAGMGVNAEKLFISTGRFLKLYS